MTEFPSELYPYRVWCIMFEKTHYFVDISSQDTFGNSIVPYSRKTNALCKEACKIITNWARAHPKEADEWFIDFNTCASKSRTTAILDTASGHIIQNMYLSDHHFQLINQGIRRNAQINLVMAAEAGISEYIPHNINNTPYIP